MRDEEFQAVPGRETATTTKPEARSSIRFFQGGRGDQDQESGGVTMEIS